MGKKTLGATRLARRVSGSSSRLAMLLEEAFQSGWTLKA